MKTLICFGFMLCVALAYASAVPPTLSEGPPKDLVVPTTAGEELTPEESRWHGGWGGWGGWGGHRGWGHGWGHHGYGRGHGWGGYGGGWRHGGWGWGR